MVGPIRQAASTVLSATVSIPLGTRPLLTCLEYGETALTAERAEHDPPIAGSEALGILDVLARLLDRFASHHAHLLMLIHLPSELL